MTIKAFIQKLLQEIKTNHLTFQESSQTTALNQKVAIQDVISTAMKINQSNNIAMCDSQLKAMIERFAQTGFYINLKDMADSPIKSIRLLTFNGFNSKARMLMMKAPLNYYISVTDHYGQKCRFIIKDESQLLEANFIQTFLSEVDDSLLEVVIPKSVRLDSQPLPSQEWATMYQGENQVDNYYNNVTDPSLLKAVSSALDDIPTEQPPVIIELGAGRGRTAEKILSLDTIQAYGCTYVFVEPSTEEIQVAKKRLAALIHQKDLNGLVDIIFVNSLATPDALASFKGQADLMISSGGPFNDQVVTHGQASASAQLTFECLKPSGQVFLTGLTGILLNRKDFESYGFMVNSMSTRVTSQDFFEFNKGIAEKKEKTEFLQLYALQKPHKKRQPSILSTEISSLSLLSIPSYNPISTSLTPHVLNAIQVIAKNLSPLKKLNLSLGQE